MIELVFIACLKAAPTACEIRSLSYLEQMSAMQCVMQAQPQLAEWVKAHPTHEVHRWSCQEKGSRGIKA